MALDKDIILDSIEIERKLRRMAYEIYESNFKEKNLVIAGIDGEGFKMAELLMEQVKSISDLNLSLVKIVMDKKNPHKSTITLKGDEIPASNSAVVVCDDVLNTGRTLIYSLRPFLDMKIKKIEVAVLIDRSHGQFPVKANYTGLGLSTTLNDHIKVSLTDSMEVQLN